jgi:O-antigen/teichoic acid export membrane protein
MIREFHLADWCTLGNAIYRATDGLVINAGFPAGTLPGYTYNYRFCEIAVFLVLTASFVSLHKITQWMSSPNEADQRRVRIEIRRLNQFQTLLGCGAALAYLAGNDLFMKAWHLHKENPIPPAPLFLQLAFALNLTVTASGDTGIQLAMRAGGSGLRVAGTMIGVTGLINVALSLVAMVNDSLWGIAMATVLAQSLLSLGSSYFVCRFLKTSWLPWVLRGWLLPLLMIAGAGWVRTLLPLDNLAHGVELAGIYTVLFLLLAWSLGVNAAFIREEWAIIRGFLKK